MPRFRTALLTASLFAGLAGPASTQLLAAEPAAGSPKPALLFDPQQLPTFHGKVAQYSLTPWGGVDGYILDDGSQVQIGHHLASQIAFVAKPGDSVTIHGVKASSGSLILAVSVVNDAGGAPLIAEQRHHGREGGMVAQGRIKMQLRNHQDEVDGVLLEDGTEIRVWPGQAERIAAQLAPGQTIYARGFGKTTLLGTVVVARAIGPTEAEAAELPHPMMRHWLLAQGFDHHGEHGVPNHGDMNGLAGEGRGQGGGHGPHEAPIPPPPGQPGQ